MTKIEILNKIKNLKPKYEEEGFVLLGLFGSYARGEEKDESDIDILYDLEPKRFLQLYPGFRALSRIEKLQDELCKEFDSKVDMADKSTLNEIGRKYILGDVIYV
jgi:predicted nucleotidyltransferase